jgi:hypothetical protein
VCVPPMLPSQFKNQCALYDSWWSTVNNLQIFPSKGSNCCKNQLYVQDLVPKFLVRISCIMTKYGDPHKEHLHKITCFKFLHVWKVSKAFDINFASFYLLMKPPSKTLLSSLREINFLTQIKSCLHRRTSFGQDSILSRNQLLGVLKII